MAESAVTIIQASAGTGKTFALSNRYLSLLFRGESPSRILASTFTRKAAGEIVSRIYTRLCAAALSEDGAKKLAAELNLPITQSTAEKTLRDLVRQQDRLSIFTLDAFFFSIAKAFGQEIGLNAEWKLASESQRLRAFSVAVDQALGAVGSDEMLLLLRAVQRGEGKKNISGFLSNSLNDLLQVWSATNQASWDWVDDSRYQALDRPYWTNELGQLPPLLTKANIPDKMFASALLKLIAAVQGNDDEAILLSGLIAGLASGTYAKKQYPDAWVTPLTTLGGIAREMYRKKLAQQNRATFALLTHLESYRQTELRRRSRLSFADVTGQLVSLLSEQLLEEVYFRLDSRISHILLDEFQDTSLQQWQLLKPLADEKFMRPEDSSVFFVGDVKQSIYGWRQGKPELLESLPDQFPGGSVETFATTRRCAPAVVDFINEVFSDLDSRLEQFPGSAKRWAKAFQIHSSTRSASPGFVECHLLEAASDEEAELATDPMHERVLTCIERFHAHDPGQEVAVLLRSNASVITLLNYLRPRLSSKVAAEGVAYLEQEPAVTALLAICKLMLHPEDSAAKFEISGSRLLDILYEGDANTFEEKISSLRETFFSVGVGGFVQSTVRKMLPRCSRHEESLLEFAGRAVEEVEADFGRFAADEFIAAIKSSKLQSTDRTQVRLMTIHTAKGLEFDIVIVPEVEWELFDGRKFPSYLTLDNSPLATPQYVSRYVKKELLGIDPALSAMYDQLRERSAYESLCLLYVALTRAKDGLVVMAKASAISKPNSVASLVFAGQVEPLYTTGNYKEVRSQKRTEKKSQDFTLQIPAANVLPLRTLPRSYASEVLGTGVYFDRQGIELGVLGHALLAKIEWIDSISLAQISLSDNEMAFLPVLQSTELRKIFSKERYVAPSITLHREKALLLREENTLLLGRLDRLVIERDRNGRATAAELIDFKFISGQATPESLRKRYSSQLERYAIMCARMTKLAPQKIRRTVVMIDTSTMARPFVSTVAV